MVLIKIHYKVVMIQIILKLCHCYMFRKKKNYDEALDRNAWKIKGECIKLKMLDQFKVRDTILE